MKRVSPSQQIRQEIFSMGLTILVDHNQIAQIECLRSGIWGTKSLWSRVKTYRG